MTRSGNGGWRRANRPGRPLAAAAACALVVAAAGLRTAQGASLTTAGPAANSGLAIAALFALGTLTAAAKYRTHIRLTEAPTAAVDRLRTATAVILYATAGAVPLILLGLHRGSTTPQPDATPTPNTTAVYSNPPHAQTTPSQQPRPTGPGLHIDFGLLLLILAAVLFAAALAALAVLVTRLLRGAEPAGHISAGRPDPADADETALADALAAGRAALGGDDARAAIIACYAAMEVSLGRAGIARQHADSPSDLLRRAIDSEALGTGDATVLTALFREARYSTHPMGEAQLAAARTSLDAITAQLAAHRATRQELGAR